jgi:hypothetical protein
MPAAPAPTTTTSRRSTSASPVKFRWLSQAAICLCARYSYGILMRSRPKTPASLSSAERGGAESGECRMILRGVLQYSLSLIRRNQPPGIEKEIKLVAPPLLSTIADLSYRRFVVRLSFPALGRSRSVSTSREIDAKMISSPLSSRGELR